MAIPVDADAPRPAVLAYYTYDKGASPALHGRGAYFNQVAMDLCSVTAEGVVSGAVPQDDLAFAHAHGMAAFATVSNYAGSDFNAQVAHAILTTPAYTQTFIDGMLAKLKLGRYQGINIDFESITAPDRNAYSAFVRTVAQRMKAAGYLTMVSVPAKEVDDPKDSWAGAFDYKALGAAADLLQVMTYDENGPWGAPGPVAGLDWVELSIKFALSQVAPGKINMGVPAFGYDWDLVDKTKSRQITWIDFEAKLASLDGEQVVWDAASSSPHFTYSANGHAHVVWGENAHSLGLKMQLVAKYHLAGVSIYALGMEDEAFWKAIHAGGL
ncbi:MAG TPA: glycosyl hydrolase family 18 protein [Candidatus Methylacidiphilales bacterium]|nr:glycosyl hydrolase family 18 protein [Candidatus Methylacidiphilales bacterium]